MRPIPFQHQTVVIAENQPPYLPLPACACDRETISCWHVSWFERIKLLFTGRLWLHQLNFGEQLQPQLPSVDCPFIEVTNNG